MPLLFALLKIHLVLCVGYLLYRYCLSPLTFFRLNRIFLVGVLLAAAVAPFLSFTLIGPAPEMLQAIRFPSAAVPTAAIQPIPQDDSSLWLTIAGWTYGAGAAVIAIVSLFRVASLLTLYRKSPKALYKGYSIRILKGNPNPFSCFGSIFLDPELHHSDDLPAILQHEQAHIRQQHSVDLTLGILFKITCWCNPAAWLLDKAIRNNLEFLADEAVLHEGIAPRQYQYALLHTTAGHSLARLGHPFNATHLKNRIQMMNKARSSTLQLIRYGVALSIFMALLLVVSLSFGQQPKPPKSATVQQQSVQNSRSQAPLITANKKEQPSLQGIDPKKVKSLTVAKAQSRTTDVDGVKEEEPHVIKSTEEMPATNRPLILIDGQIVGTNSMLALKPESIVSATIIKEESALAKYGEAGKNGAILITTKK